MAKRSRRHPAPVSRNAVARSPGAANRKAIAAPGGTELPSGPSRAAIGFGPGCSFCMEANRGARWSSDRSSRPRAPASGGYPSSRSAARIRSFGSIRSPGVRSCVRAGVSRAPIVPVDKRQWLILANWRRRRRSISTILDPMLTLARWLQPGLASDNRIPGVDTWVYPGATVLRALR